MKKILVAVIAATIALGLSAPASANGPSFEDRAWTNDMNQTSYWSPWVCTKYEGHNGHIGAQYDAAIIKDASSFVRVYSNLEDVGAFTASHPKGDPPYSWVMKCTKPTPPTTVPETTVPETTVPETTVPETTVPQTTVPATTVPDTTVPPTTAPATTTPATTVVVATGPPPTPPAAVVPPPASPADTLPATGSETTLALLAGLLTLVGTGTVLAARRR